MKSSIKSIAKGILAVIGLVILPMSAFAATYEYVNTSGYLETESAVDAAQALAQPTDKAPNSGVMLVSSDPVTVGVGLYEYVNTSGFLETVTANSSAQALLIAPDIAPNSGVMLVNS